MSSRAPRFVALSCMLAACAPRGTPAAAPVARSPSAGRGDAGREERRALFDDLVASIRRLDVFAPATARNLGFRWDDDLPALREEILAADSPAKLDVAMCHFGNSLHDAHCGFLPATPNGPTLGLGFTTDVEWVEDRARFYVASVEDPALAKAVHAGDVVVSVDGVRDADLLRAYRFTSNHGNWRSIAAEVAEHLARRRRPRWLVADGDRSTWELRSRATGEVSHLDAIWRPVPDGDRDDSDYAVDFTRIDCDSLPERRYGGYRIVARGFDYCVYASDDAARRSYPVVRHFTFHYDGARPNLQHLLRADHDNLRDALARIGDVRGLIVDLRDNTGGNNANLFLDWYAPPKPYVGDFFFPRLDPAFATREALGNLVNLDGPVADEYLRVVAHWSRAGDPFSLRLPDTWGPDGFDLANRHAASHQVTRAPVALLVGPRCASSCDVVVRVFADGGFGPLVGTPPAGVNSMIQLRRQLMARDGRRLGELRIPFSKQASGTTGEEVQGVVPKIDVLVEKTFDDAARYDAKLVESAIAALAGREVHGS